MLRHKEDRRVIASILVFMLQVLFAFVYYDAMNLWMKTALLISICWFAFINATITHNTVHAPMFHSGKMNRLNQFFISMAYGHPVSTFVRGHNFSHHLHVQTQKDVMRTTKMRFKWNLLNQALFFFVVLKDITRTNKEYARRMKVERPHWFKQYRQEQYVVWVTTILMLALNWKAFLLFFLVPRIFGAWAIVGMNFFQHDGCDETHPYNHSRNFVGPWVNWWTFNNGYHGIHHEYPALHWSRLPARHAKEYAPHVHSALDQRSLLTYAFAAYIYPGKRITYDGKPYDPPPAGEDIDWYPGANDSPEGVSLGAIGST